VKVEKGIAPRSTVRLVFHGDAQWSLDESHRLQSLAEILRIRLREELREDRGGVYGVGVSAGLSRWPEEEYTFNISFSADPARVDELVAAVLEEIRKLKAEGPVEDYVSRVHEMQRREREVELKQNGFWASQLEYLSMNGLDFAEIGRYDQRIAAVTRDSMRAAARKYLDETRYVLGVLDPEKAAPATE
jgi:zinc protease